MPYEPGAPLENGIPLCVPELRGNEWKYVKDCLDTNWVSSAGAYVDRFEHAIAEYVGVHHAVATCNGTAALHVALLVAGVQPDDEVLVSSLTFIAPVNAIRYVGAWPVFIDCELDYWQMDVSQVADFLETGCHVENGAIVNRSTGRRVSAILPVSILGHPVDFDPVMHVARRFKLPVIEDATESLGSLYRGRTSGSLGDLACLSFNGNKLITTGGGGMLVTNNEGWARRARYLSTQAKDDPLEYVHGEVGYNYRLTNIQAALGCAQVERLDEYVKAKRSIAERYAAGLATVPGIDPMPEAPWARSVYWLYTILVNQGEYGIDRRGLLSELAKDGIQTRPLWQPMHLSPAHSAPHRSCPIAESLQTAALSLPSSVGLDATSQNMVVDAIRRHSVR